MEIRASDDDMLTYLDTSLSKLPSFVVKDHRLQDKIKSAVIKAADGMLVSLDLTYIFFHMILLICYQVSSRKTSLILTGRQNKSTAACDCAGFASKRIQCV
jgi:hypothetical protein